MGYFFSLFSLSKSATAGALNWSELTLFLFGVVLVAGLVGEYKTLETHSRRMKFFEMLVIIGVCGELLADGGVFLLSHELQVISDQEIAEANKNAGDAATSAKTARDELNVIKKESEEINEQLSDASQRLALLTEDVAEQGPRWRLVANAAPTLVEKLCPFSGQRVILAVVGSQSTMNGEMGATWGDIAEILNEDGAKWKVERGGLVFLDHWPRNYGIAVLVNSAAPRMTRNAARALSDGLSKALPPSRDKMLVTIAPDFATKPWNRIWVEDRENPVMWVLESPDLIVVTIGAHPEQQVNEQTKRKFEKGLAVQ